ncbi:MAG: threonine--tRNA ligase [Syntrophomonadaceae bacterium]|nr:threonine--tRNA ligase [Syntrophomonadaceae bacterium]
MELVSIRLKDGSVNQYQKGITPMEIAAGISKRLAKEAFIAKFNGILVDLDRPLNQDGTLELLTEQDDEAMQVLRHSAAHIMAQAVQNLFPGTRLGIGPAIQDGFYYDFDSEHVFIPSDLELIEQEMKRIINEDYPFLRRTMKRDEAIEYFGSYGEKYKEQLIAELPEDVEISLYSQGDFNDLCAGPHIPSAGKLKAYKLLSLAGAYWKGNEANKMLQRIYGTCFFRQNDLNEHLHRLEEAKKRDHRKLGPQLSIYTLEEEGPGFPFFHPKGMVIRNELELFWREEHKKRGYLEIKTPIILSRELWERSGHWDHYKQNMYFTNIDEDIYAIKPMNCPGAMLVYSSSQHSYRDLPIRMGELGLVHRHEKSGVLHGLMRVRAFTQDDAHIFMLPSQITEEIKGVIDLVDYFYQVFGFKYRVELSTKPEKSMGSPEIWDAATGALRRALEEKGMNYRLNEGEGAFYGPKIDFHLKDSLGRTWQCGTIQLDFQMPEKFDLTYIGEDGQKHRPVMIHRVVFGSIERFIGILTEHYAGAFPLWLSPIQARILTVTDRVNGYALQVAGKLREKGIRVETDLRNEKIGYKIREGQIEKTPYLLIVGDKEAEQENVSVRQRGVGDIGTVDLEELLGKLHAEIVEKR